MRRAVVLMSLIAVLAAAGCEQRDPSEEPRAFDPAIDPAPSPLFARLDPMLVANQTEISKNAPRPAELAAGPSSDEAAIQAVKPIVAEMLAALAAGQFDRVQEFFVPADARLVRNWFASFENMKRKTDALKDQVGQMGGKMPRELTMAGQFGAATDIFSFRPDGAELEKRLDSLTYTVSDGKVVVADPNGGSPVTFVRSGGQWKRQLGPEQRAGFSAITNVIGSYEQYLDSLTSQIQAGTITSYDLAEKSKAIYESTVAPAMEAMRTAEYEASKAPQAAAAGTETPAAPAEAPPEQPAGTENPGHMVEAIALWEAGEQDKAVEAFMQIDWAKPAEFAPGYALGMTSDEFDALSPDAAGAKTAEAQAQASAIYGICERAQKLSRNAAMLGNQAGAARYVRGVVACGEFLQGADRLANFQVVGEVFSKATVPETTGAPATPSAPAAPAAPSNAAPSTQPAEAGVDNMGGGPQSAEQLRRRLTAPARRLYGGG